MRLLFKSDLLWLVVDKLRLRAWYLAKESLHIKKKFQVLTLSSLVFKSCPVYQTETPGSFALLH